LYTDFADWTDFFRFYGEFRVVRAIRVQKLVLPSDFEKIVFELVNYMAVVITKYYNVSRKFSTSHRI